MKKISKIIFYLLVFLFPLFFFPFSADAIFYPKAVLFYSFISLSFFFWFLHLIFATKITLRGHFLFYLSLVLLLFFVGLSNIFSTDRIVSFFGFPFRIEEGFLFLFFSILFVFLLLNLFEEKKEIYFLFFLLSLSSFFLIFFLIFQLFKQKTIFDIFVFNPLGDISVAPLFFVILFFPTISLLFQAKKFLKIFFGIFSFFTLFLIVISQIKLAWVLLSLGIVFLLIFTLERKTGEIDLKRGLVFSLILIVSIFFYFFPKIFGPRIPQQNFPGILAELPILRGVFSESVKNILLGSGPATFVFSYSKYRPLILNETIYWGIRFSAGANTILDWLITKGVLNAFLFLFIFLLTLFLIFKNLFKEREKFSLFEIGIFGTTFTLFCTSFFYPFEMLLWFLFWLFLGFSLFILTKKTEVEFSKVPLLKAIFFVIFVLISLTSLILTGLQFKNYLADFYYKKAIIETQKDLNLAIVNLKKAIKINSEVDIYWRDLAQILLLKANQIALQEDFSLEERRAKVSQIINEGVEALNKTIELSPKNVANWNVRGFFYRNLIGLTGAEQLALSSYQEALKLEPNSPYSLGEIGRVYILMAQEFEGRGEEEKKKEVLSLAKNALEEALRRKSDYTPAHYLMAVVFSQEGREEEVITKLEEVLRLNPDDLMTVFQLSVLYYRGNQLEKAKILLEETLKRFSDYSNARYLLGLIYDQMGEKEKAILEFERVAKLNPENREVNKILENLKKGLPALEGLPFPLQETPPEIKQ